MFIHYFSLLCTCQEFERGVSFKVISVKYTLADTRCWFELNTVALTLSFQESISIPRLSEFDLDSQMMILCIKTLNNTFVIIRC